MRKEYQERVTKKAEHDRRLQGQTFSMLRKQYGAVTACNMYKAIWGNFPPEAEDVL